MIRSTMALEFERGEDTDVLRYAAMRGWLCALPLIAACTGAGGTLTVSWQAPTRNTDGTALTDLKGYTIRYGTRPGVYTMTMSVDDPSATRAVIRGLQPGVDYYFVISTNSAAGGHSVLSGEVHGKARRDMGPDGSKGSK